MTDRARYAQIENEIRQNMAIAIQILRPYAQSAGSFNDWNDLRSAITTAMHALERAQLAADHKLPPTC
jgi:hypothetical protein